MLKHKIHVRGAVETGDFTVGWTVESAYDWPCSGSTLPYRDKNKKIFDWSPWKECKNGGYQSLCRLSIG